MEQRRLLMILGGVAGLILIITLVVVLIIRRGGDQKASVTQVAPVLPGAASSTAPSGPQGDQIQTGVKTYSGRGFSLKYPAGWGLLTCGNSQNFELDPYNQTDQLNTGCDVARKPITFLVTTAPSCPGSLLQLGSNPVVKSLTGTKGSGEVSYRWCTQSSPSLDITHRVTQSNSQASSKDDFSLQVEQVIASIKFGS
ncbi:hypothetical protein HY389_00360 [Candidatus Daviesbacteria bacterium]|nr:hypothetical protein [Candidatus Daviesbacteria bacterium]